MTAAHARLLVQALVSGRFRFNRGAGLIEIFLPDNPICTRLILDLDEDEMPMLDEWQEEIIRGHMA